MQWLLPEIPSANNLLTLMIRCSASLTTISSDSKRPGRREYKTLSEITASDKNIVTLEAAEYAAFYIYDIKFLSKHNDKNLITFPTDGKNMVTFSI